jgi:hypothetical protein
VRLNIRVYAPLHDLRHRNFRHLWEVTAARSVVSKSVYGRVNFVDEPLKPVCGYAIAVRAPLLAPEPSAAYPSSGQADALEADAGRTMFTDSCLRARFRNIY